MGTMEPTPVSASPIAMAPDIDEQSVEKSAKRSSEGDGQDEGPAIKAASRSNTGCEGATFGISIVYTTLVYSSPQWDIDDLLAILTKPPAPEEIAIVQHALQSDSFISTKWTWKKEGSGYVVDDPDNTMYGLGIRDEGPDYLVENTDMEVWLALHRLRQEMSVESGQVVLTGYHEMLAGDRSQYLFLGPSGGGKSKQAMEMRLVPIGHNEIRPLMKALFRERPFVIWQVVQGLCKTVKEDWMKRILHRVLCKNFPKSDAGELQIDKCAHQMTHKFWNEFQSRYRIGHVQESRFRELPEVERFVKQDGKVFIVLNAVPNILSWGEAKRVSHEFSTGCALGSDRAVQPIEVLYKLIKLWLDMQNDDPDIKDQVQVIGELAEHVKSVADKSKIEPDEHELPPDSIVFDHDGMHWGSLARTTEQLRRANIFVKVHDKYFQVS